MAPTIPVAQIIWMIECQDIEKDKCTILKTNYLLYSSHILYFLTNTKPTNLRNTLNLDQVLPLEIKGWFELHPPSHKFGLYNDKACLHSAD